MSNYIDKTGQIFNNCIVIEIDKKRSEETKRIHWFLKCQNCGNILSRRTDSLKNIKCTCKKRHYSQNNEKRIQEMIGKRFGKLTVLECVENERANDGSLVYKCQCDCGNIKNISGAYLRKGTKSCGCLIGKNQNLNIEDLSGQEFNNIKILSITDKRDPNRAIIYKCQCKCGKIFECSGTRIKNGFIKSCGCLREENLKKYLETVDYSKDETGKIYGELKVLYRNGSTSNWQAIWHCKCSCGKEIDITGGNLRQGQISCGCQKQSKEVYNIFNILKNNNFIFETEKTFLDCKDQKLLPFDFYIDNKYIIEFDGSQHFKSFDFFGGEEKFKTRKIHDLLKNKYCFDNNIPLIRIPWDAEYTLNDLKLETTRFLLTPENEEEYYDSRI